MKLSSGLRGSGCTECTETGLGVGGGVISSGCLGKTLRRLLLFLSVVGSNSMTLTRTCSGSGRVPAIARARIMQSAVARDRKEAVLARRVITRWKRVSSIQSSKSFPGPRVLRVVGLPGTISFYRSLSPFP